MSRRNLLLSALAAAYVAVHVAAAYAVFADRRQRQRRPGPPDRPPAGLAEGSSKGIEHPGATGVTAPP
jgi:hypothetical protein